MSDAHASDDISKHVKTYFMVFGALMVLTVVTVAISYLHLATHEAIIVALFIATIKASMVALFFMHLNHERTLIYWVLGLTVVFFAVLMLVPISTNLDKIVQEIEVMSLKWFHIVFISLSTLMGVAIGVWGLFNGFLLLGVASLASSAALCVYGTYFLQKARREGLV